MRFQVTQQDIDNANKAGRLPRKYCPIAQCMRRVYGAWDTDVSYGRALVFIGYKGMCRDFPLPVEAIRFQMQFDENKPVSPFQFESEDRNAACYAHLDYGMPINDP